MDRNKEAELGSLAQKGSGRLIKRAGRLWSKSREQSRGKQQAGTAMRSLLLVTGTLPKGGASSQHLILYSLHCEQQPAQGSEELGGAPRKRRTHLKGKIYEAVKMLRPGS